MAIAILAALEEQPGGAAEYARRHTPLITTEAASDGGSAVKGSKWQAAARIEALRRR